MAGLEAPHPAHTATCVEQQYWARQLPRYVAFHAARGATIDDRAGVLLLVRDEGDHFAYLAQEMGQPETLASVARCSSTHTLFRARQHSRRAPRPPPASGTQAELVAWVREQSRRQRRLTMRTAMTNFMMHPAAPPAASPPSQSAGGVATALRHATAATAGLAAAAAVVLLTTTRDGVYTAVGAGHFVRRVECRHVNRKKGGADRWVMNNRHMFNEHCAAQHHGSGRPCLYRCDVPGCVNGGAGQRVPLNYCDALLQACGTAHPGTGLVTVDEAVSVAAAPPAVPRR